MRGATCKPNWPQITMLSPPLAAGRPPWLPGLGAPAGAGRACALRYGRGLGRGQISRLRERLDQHWVNVVTACVQGDDPLGFGIDKLRQARTTVARQLGDVREHGGVELTWLNGSVGLFDAALEHTRAGACSPSPANPPTTWLTSWGHRPRRRPAAPCGATTPSASRPSLTVEAMSAVAGPKRGSEANPTTGITGRPCFAARCR